VAEAVTAVRRTPAHAVALPAIPDALRAIWRDCCADQPDVDVSRALTHNFVGVADAARAPDLRLAVDTLSARLPCRAFLVALVPGAAPLRAEVFGAARPFGRALDLVLEQIELQAPRSAFAHVAGVVRPLLVNDLPTHLYWAMDWPARPADFDALLMMAEHAIVDSARFSAPEAQLDAVEQRRQQGSAITDLNWLRLRPWRRALAEAFERCGHDRERPTAVTIRHGGAAPAAALLLGRWLEQRLGATVGCETADGAPGCVVGVELQHGDASVAAAQSGQGRIEVQVTTAESCFVPFSVPASRGSEGDLLAAAIDLA
jgi:hypothetical protein